MTGDDYLGYVLDCLDPGERAAVAARVAAHPGAAADLDRVRAAVLPLDADRDDPAPPPGLAARTLARVAAVLVAEAAASAVARLPTPVPDVTPAPERRPDPPADRPEPRVVGGRFRADLIVAAGIGLVVFGLAVSSVGRLRYQSDRLACQNNLMTLHQGLSGYADTRDGRFPQVGVGEYPTAGSFVAALRDAGQCPPGFHAVCPATPRTALDDNPAVTRPAPVTYAYPLGYFSPGGALVGPRRAADPAGENDQTPVAADFPVAAAAPTAGPTSPHRWGQNVLYAGGHVRFAATPLVGVGGDDIYINRQGRVAAGLDPADAVLGRGDDRP